MNPDILKLWVFGELQVEHAMGLFEISRSHQSCYLVEYLGSQLLVARKLLCRLAWRFGFRLDGYGCSVRRCSAVASGKNEAEGK